MKQVENITYEEWVALVRRAGLDGLTGEVFEALQVYYPLSSGSAYEKMIYNEMAKLEMQLLKKSIHRFQNAINLCMEENDLEIAKAAINSFRKNIAQCMFFVEVEAFPKELREKLSSDIYANILQFQKEVDCFSKKAMSENSGNFVQDLCYLLKKHNLAKIVMERKKNAQLYTSKEGID
ncbi:hypothetical protein [Hungatella hathewayi]|uniref:Uncharacterized protein n=1 Tax=Hungatella hathewayi WAL-18680 TaxID=742737 RepID=G5IBI5_9FIRM|nr:hypothetical protein [Hungatella hathewayi]EHI61148.1 hypothetical protein HMPREF9473_00763 [ [Hungatella hathewayi WAL-18680]MBS4984237.1 hypothetical protein [Hungatella hathewayi]